MFVTTAAVLVATISATAAPQAPASGTISEQTLLTNHITNGGYGGPVQRFSTVAGKSVVFSGAEGGWIVNHRFVLGGAGYGLATQNIRNDGAVLRDTKGRAPVVELGYGGVTFGYVQQPMKLVHLTAQVLVGGGGLTYDTEDIAGVRPEDAPTDAFFVVEPSVHGELNVARFFRVGVGAGYRYISGARLDGLSDRDLRGVSASLTFKFGRF
jgi:hypothetical protein